jgi:hypothetical protein
VRTPEDDELASELEEAESEEDTEAPSDEELVATELIEEEERVACSLHPKKDALYRCKVCKRHLCAVCSKGAKKGVCRRCMDRRARQTKGFCESCSAASNHSSCGNVFSFRGVGTCFFGESDRCGRCGSVVKTVWIQVILPVYPVGSYRFITTNEPGFFSRAEYVSRGVPLHRAHVRNFGILWAVVVTLLALVIGVAVLKG